MFLKWKKNTHSPIEQQWREFMKEAINFAFGKTKPMFIFDESEYGGQRTNVKWKFHKHRYWNPSTMHDPALNMNPTICLLGKFAVAFCG